MKLYWERSPQGKDIVIGAETPLGSGFFSVPCGKRDLLRYAGCAAAAGVGLALRARRGKKEAPRRARRGGFRR